MMRLHVVRQKHNAHRRILGTYALSRDKPFICLGRRHSDIENYDIRVVLVDETKKGFGLARLGNDLEPPFCKEAFDTFSEE